MTIEIIKGVETPVTKFFCSSPETDAFFLKRGVWSDEILAFCRKLERERDEWRKKFELSVDAVEVAARLARAESERDEAREQIKELIYIAERAIALAEIDFENDKFGVVSELRDGLGRIKGGAK
jgi:hypothetical protein